MVALYFKIAMFMVFVFSFICYAVPFYLWFSGYMKHISNGGDYDTYNVHDNIYLKNIDKFLDSIEVYDTEERAIFSIVAIILFSLLWIIGIFVVGIFGVSLQKKVSNEMYELATKKKTKGL